jgi:hypothetical protein
MVITLNKLSYKIYIKPSMIINQNLSSFYFCELSVGLKRIYKKQMKHLFGQGRTGHSGNETLVAVAFSITRTKCQKRAFWIFFVWNVVGAFWSFAEVFWSQFTSVFGPFKVWSVSQHTLKKGRHNRIYHNLSFSLSYSFFILQVYQKSTLRATYLPLIK